MPFQVKWTVPRLPRRNTVRGIAVRGNCGSGPVKSSAPGTIGMKKIRSPPIAFASFSTGTSCTPACRAQSCAIPTDSERSSSIARVVV